jgi:hypothetical protein
MPTLPLNPPSTPGYTDSEFGVSYAVAQTRSPFTFQRQVQEHQGAMWRATLTLPPMARAQAEQWIAFLLSCNGRKNPFLLGDPDGKVNRGSWTGGTTAGTVAGAATTMVVRMGGTKVAAAGDYFQSGTGTLARLHKLIENCTAATSGTGTLSFTPPIREAIGSGVALTLGTAKGAFCLADNDQGMWTADKCSRYGLSFSCEEAF